MMLNQTTWLVENSGLPSALMPAAHCGASSTPSTIYPKMLGERARRPCKQTSLIVDPPNGRTPDLLPEARTRRIPEGAGNNTPKADSWEDFSYYIRCISRGVTGSIFPVIYGN